MKRLKKVMTTMPGTGAVRGLVAPGFAAPFSELREIIYATEDGGTVKLEDDYEAVEEDRVSWIQVDRKDITLDLNGHTLTGDGRTSVIYVINGGLTLEDSAGGGLITGGNAGNGGGILVHNSDLTMNGGTVSGNTGKMGGGVYVQGGSFTMNGGEISGNNAAYGGGIYIGSKAEVTVSGGEISENTAKTYAGGIYQQAHHGKRCDRRKRGEIRRGRHLQCGRRDGYPAQRR